MRVQVAGVVADRVQQVGLAQAGLAVDEERVVGLGRRLGHRDRGGVGEPVAGADDEGLEGVLRVEPGVLDQLGHRLLAALLPLGDERRVGRRVDRVLGLVVVLVVPVCRVVATGERPHRREPTGRRSRVGLGEGCIDGDGEPDVVAVLVGECLGQLPADLGLDDVLGVVVRDRDEGGVRRSARSAWRGTGTPAAASGCRRRPECPVRSARRGHSSTSPSGTEPPTPHSPRAVRGSGDPRDDAIHTFVHRLWVRVTPPIHGGLERPQQGGG